MKLKANIRANGSKIKVNILLSRGMEAPAYATAGAAAVDLRAAIDEGETLTIAPHARVLVPTGLAIAPEGNDVVAVVAARSGLAIKHGITLSNGIGVIDADYRGEIQVGLLNTSDEPFTVSRGDRVAQLLFMPVFAAQLVAVDALPETERGEGGFGSTGIQ